VRKKGAVNNGLVLITDRSRPARVLMNMEFYRRPTMSRQKIADLMAMAMDSLIAVTARLSWEFQPLLY
jgi:PHD/YefM family antitoxin component YafN of YafNO toxin-antitoxin module